MAVGRFDKIILGTGLTGTDNADGSITIDGAAAGSVATDAIWDNVGDIAIGSGANTADNLPVGADGLVLTANSGETLGVEWASAGATPAVTLISDTTLGSDGTFDVSSISGAYNDLILVLIARSARASNTTDDPLIRFNNDSGSNYAHQRYGASGGGAIAASYTASSAFPYCGYLPAATADANVFGHCEIIIPGYASTAWKKIYRWWGYAPGVIATANENHIRNGGGSWNSTNAITRIQIVSANSANLKTGSWLRIYGRI